MVFYFWRQIKFVMWERVLAIRVVFEEEIKLLNWIGLYYITLKADKRCAVTGIVYELVSRLPGK
jgi:hypothetical protein